MFAGSKMKKLYWLGWILRAGIFGIANAQCNNGIGGNVSAILLIETFTTRASWCVEQSDTCAALCGVWNGDNLCDPSTLDYYCNCANDLIPSLSLYENTIPWYECITWKGSCIASNANDLPCQQICNETYICGTDTASLLNIPSLSTTSTSTTTSVVILTASILSSLSTVSIATTSASSSTTTASVSPSTTSIVTTRTSSSTTVKPAGLSTASSTTTRTSSSISVASLGPFTTSIITASGITSSTTAASVEPSTQSISPGVDAAAAMAAIILLLLLVLVIWFLLRRRRQNVVVKVQKDAYEKAELDPSVERMELSNSQVPRGNELDGNENERRELDANTAIPELAGQARAELAARRSARYEAP